MLYSGIGFGKSLSYVMIAHPAIVGCIDALQGRLCYPIVSYLYFAELYDYLSRKSTV